MSARTNGTASAFMRRQREPMVAIDADVMDIGRRIQQGDELWRGDPSMALTYNAWTGEFEVIALDGKGEPYVVVSAPECDQRILIQLAESDWQRDAKQRIAAFLAKEAKARADADARHADISGEMADKLAWGLKRAFAGHMGGKSWSYSFNTPGRR